MQLEKDISAQTSASQILDARLDTVFSQGHIQHAKNLVFKQLFNPLDNTLKTKEEVLAAFNEAGVDLIQELVCSCNSGMTATALMAALEHYEIAKGEVKLYDGSWTEYSAKQKEG